MTSTDKRIHLDVCGLQPPEPLERVLEALSTLQRDQTLCVLIDREPIPLFRILEKNGFAYDMQTRPDYLYDIAITYRS
jgi:uncharacterized protein (DUF2249 family)